MNTYFDELYYLELESNRLTFEQDVDYHKALDAFCAVYDQLYQNSDHRQCERLWEHAIACSNESARLAFGHGFRLAMSLAMGRG